MSSTLWMCLILIGIYSCHARPNFPPDDSDSRPSEQPEEQINLHHSLKEAQDSAIKAVKDIGGYFQQKFTSIAKKQINLISRPLIRLMGPVLYFKDQINNLTGINKPSQEEDINDWCSTCLQPHGSGEIVPTSNSHTDHFHDANTDNSNGSDDTNVYFTTTNAVESSTLFTDQTYFSSKDTNIKALPQENVNNSGEPFIIIAYPVEIPNVFTTPGSDKLINEAESAESDINIRLGEEYSSSSRENDLKPETEKLENLTTFNNTASVLA